MTSHLANDVTLGKVAIDAIRQAGIDESDRDFAALVESECDILERLRRMLRAARFAEADMKALDGLIAEMRERKERLGEKAKRLRAAVTWALGELGMKRLDAPDLTATLTPGKPALVGELDAALLPDRFCRVKREPDRPAIRAALEAGELIEGIYLGNADPILTVRTK